MHGILSKMYHCALSTIILNIYTDHKHIYMTSNNFFVMILTSQESQSLIRLIIELLPFTILFFFLWKKNPLLDLIILLILFPPKIENYIIHQILHENRRRIIKFSQIKTTLTFCMLFVRFLVYEILLLI